jgi:heptosyltransferase-3
MPSIRASAACPSSPSESRADERAISDRTQPRSYDAPSRVLICRPNARLGNTLLLTPLVQELEDTFPGAEIDVLTAFPAAEEIFRPFSSVRTIHQLPYPGAAHVVKHVLTFVRALRTHYDLIVDPCPRSWSSRFAARALRGRVKVGFCSPRKRDGINLSVPMNALPEHMAAYGVHLIRNAFAASGKARSSPIARLSLRLSASEREFGLRKREQLVQSSGSSYTLAVSTRATGRKQVPEGWWREMLGRATTLMPAMRVVEILPASGNAALPEYPGYFSTHLRRVAAVISASDCFVSADSGLMHLGSATDVPTVGLFKVTDPAMYAPYGGKNFALSVEKVTAAQTAERIVSLMLERADPRS